MIAWASGVGTLLTLALALGLSLRLPNAPAERSGASHAFSASVLSTLIESRNLLYDGLYPELEEELDRPERLWPHGRARLLLLHAIEIDREQRGEVRADLWTALAELEHAGGDLVAAEPLYRRALEARRLELKSGNLDLARSCIDLGRVLEDRGEYGEAENWYRKALEIRSWHLPADDPLLAASTQNLARLLESRGDLHAAFRLYLRTISLWTASLGPNHWIPVWVTSRSGSVLLELGRLAEAGPILQDTHERLARVLGSDHPRTVAAGECVADWMEATGRVEQALRFRTELRRANGM